VKEGARGRKNLTSKARIWRETHPGKLAVLHSASAGEFEAAVPLIKQLKQKGFLTLATLFSPSGYRIAEKNPEPDYTLYFPFDTKRKDKAFLKALKPSVFIFCKHDIWPNMVWECSKRGIPLLMVNTNMHPKSLRLNPLFIRYSQFIFRRFKIIFTVSEAHAERIKRILAGMGEVVIAGDTRFDRVVSRALGTELDLPQGFRNYPVFIAGSVWPAEKFVLEAFMEIRRTNPQWRLIWVPHEPNEGCLKKTASALEKEGLSHLRFSAIKENAAQDSEALLVDEVGVLPPLYRFADIAYVGGGFGKGVHSVIEPAAFGIPVIFGPHHYVSAEAEDLLRRGGGFSIKGKDDLIILLERLMTEKQLREKSGSIAGEMVKEKIGAAEVIAEKIAGIIV
jgi:3-deoxy-D-manno-octulosonic-acid transferase